MEVSCINEAGGKKLKEVASLSLAEDYSIKEVHALRPKVRIVGISKDISEDSVLSYLKKQNRNIIHQSSFIQLHRFCPIRANADIFQADLSVDTVTYKLLLLKSGHVLIGLDPCSVFDAIIVPRCYNCNGLFHGSRQCRKQPTCPLCAENHKIKDCQLYKDKSDITDKKRCINCESMRNPPDNLNTKHAAWEYDACASYKVAVGHSKKDVFRI